MWLQSEENEVNCGKMMLLASNKAEIVRYKFEVLQAASRRGQWCDFGQAVDQHHWVSPGIVFAE